jgi:stringent starvation protein B
MDRPLFVETSKGFINLDRVTYVEPSLNNDAMGFHFSGTDAAVVIPIDEWQTVWAKMTSNGLLIVD